MLVKIGDPYSPDWFMLSDLSPAIDAAIALAETNRDFFGNYRGNSPDMGAIEKDPLILMPPYFLPSVFNFGAKTR